MRGEFSGWGYDKLVNVKRMLLLQCKEIEAADNTEEKGKRSTRGKHWLGIEYRVGKGGKVR